MFDYDMPFRISNCCLLVAAYLACFIYYMVFEPMYHVLCVLIFWLCRYVRCLRTDASAWFTSKWDLARHMSSGMRSGARAHYDGAMQCVRRGTGDASAWFTSAWNSACRQGRGLLHGAHAKVAWLPCAANRAESEFRAQLASGWGCVVRNFTENPILETIALSVASTALVCHEGNPDFVWVFAMPLLLPLFCLYRCEGAREPASVYEALCCITEVVWGRAAISLVPKASVFVAIGFLILCTFDFRGPAFVAASACMALARTHATGGDSRWVVVYSYHILLAAWLLGQSCGDYSHADDLIFAHILGSRVATHTVVTNGKRQLTTSALDAIAVVALLTDLPSNRYIFVTLAVLSSVLYFLVDWDKSRDQRRSPAQDRLKEAESTRRLISLLILAFAYVAVYRLPHQYHTGKYTLSMLATIARTVLVSTC